jgi:hypothetical protein
MKDKLIQLIKDLSNKKEFDKLRFSLTINHENIINEYGSKEVFVDNIRAILNIIHSKKVKNFNFTLYENEYTFGDYVDIERYDHHWFESRFTFYGDNKIKTNLNFLSPGLSLSGLNSNYKTIEQLIEINEFYKSTSKQLYKLLN